VFRKLRSGIIKSCIHLLPPPRIFKKLVDTSSNQLVQLIYVYSIPIKEQKYSFNHRWNLYVIPTIVYKFVLLAFEFLGIQKDKKRYFLWDHLLNQF
jgi:hypothetical protein